MTLEATDTLAQNVTTDLRTPDTDAPATVPVPEGGRTEDECDSAKEDGAASEALSTQELTAEALSPKTPPSLSASSSSSSSSTSSTPSVSEERRLPAVPEEDTIAADEEYLSRGEVEETLTVSNNNPALLEVELTAPVVVDDAGSSGCINDHYNNNNNNNNNNNDISKGSDSDFQIVGVISSSSTTHTQDSERTEDGGDSETATFLSSPASRTDLEEGVQTSAAAPATKIALGQGEQRRCCVASGEGGDECTAATCQRAGCDCEHLGSRVVVSQQPPSPPPLLGKAAASSVDEDEKGEKEEVANETNDDNNCELSVAPIEIVQTEPLPSNASCTVQRQGDLITTADVVAVAEVDQQNGDERQQQEEVNEGDEVTAAQSEENETCASSSDATNTTVGASPSSSSSCCSSTTTTSAPSPSPPSSSSVSSSSSSEPSPEVVLAGSQQEPSGKGDDGDDDGGDASQLVGDNRPLGDGSPEGHSLEDGEGFPAITHHRTPPALRTVDADAAVVPQSCAEDDECRSIVSICETTELLELYRSSCKRHNAVPLQSVLEHLQSLDATKDRVPLLSLRDQHLTYGGCEALEEIFKHVQYRCIDLSHSGLNDVTASVMFDIIEYYEAATELDISDNLQMSSKSWTACINMLKKSQALNVLITRGPTISDYQANNLAKALNASAIHTLKLEHCVLSQQPIASLCNVLKRNEVLRELWLAHNQLNCEDAQQIANLLRSNFYIQLIDISNNRIGDKGVEHIVNAIVEQAVYFKDVQDKKRKSDLNFSDLSSSLNNINNSAKNYFPHQRLRSSDSESMPAGAEADENKSPSPLTLTPPVTPPSTPALPTTCETDTEETKQVAQPQASSDKQLEPTNGDATFAVAAPTVYTMQQQQQSNNDETNPPLLPPSSPSASSASSSPLTLPTLGAVAPSNVELVEMSTKHSVSLQTTSDREKLDTVAVRPDMMTAEEEALMNSSSGGATATVEAVALVTAQETGEQALSDGDGESRTMSTSAETVQTDRSESTVVVREASTGGAEEELTGTDLDKHSESPVPQAPKKPRLAKQDSVLTEFEASITTAMETGEDGEGLTEQKPKNKLSGGEGVTIPSVIEEQPSSASVMEEDVPELCSDYDDDGSNLRISQENLFVELGIPALSEQEERLEADSGAPDSPGDVFPPLVTVPSKKDELQLLIEKSKQSATGEAVADRLEQPAVPAAPQKTLAGDRERKSAISSDERPVTAAAAMPAATTKKNRTQSSSSDSYVPSAERAIQMVNVEIKDSVPLSRSLDSVGGESESDFESSSPFRTTAPGPFPNERSFSSESLNSETSIDSNDSKSSLKIHESKFAAKNGTLERQQSNRVLNRDAAGAEQAAASPGGLQVLVLWNNEMTRSSARHFQRLLEKTSTLDTLNVGSNQLCNSFVAGISGSLKANTTLTNLGLQGAHLSDKGVKTMAEIIEFGGNSSLQRIDLRHNNIQKAGLEALNEAMKSNKSVTRIDLDDTPRRIKDTSLDGVGSEYSRLVNNIRAQCERNKNPPEPSEPISTTVRRARANYLSSRKISLTCPSIKTSPSAIADKQHLLDPNGGCKKSTGGRLRSPLPSPIPSPVASPVPSPSRNRFHVSRVSDSGGGGAGGTASSPSPSSTGSSPTLFFPSNSRFRVVTVAEPDAAKSANGNPYRSSSTISLPMSKSSASSFAMGGTSCAGTMASSAGTINRRPVCSSAPTLSSFPPSPLSPLAAGGPHPQQQQQILPQTPSSYTGKGRQHSCESPHQHQHSSSNTSSTTLHDSVLSSTSIESPDLEVKRFMSGGALRDDSCCSSISSNSIESIDNAHFNLNTSISSTDESFDLIVNSPPPVTTSAIASSIFVQLPAGGAVSCSSEVSPNVSSISRIPEEESTLIARQSVSCGGEPPKATLDAPASFSSSSMVHVPLASSQESLYDVHDLSGSSNSSSAAVTNLAPTVKPQPPPPAVTTLPPVLTTFSGGSVLPTPNTTGAAPGAATLSAGGNNSNESTLTSVQNLEREPTVTKPASHSEKPPRVRKTSWILGGSGSSHKHTDSSSSGGSTPTPGGGGSGYPPAIEKLLSIFHPSNLFSSSKASSASSASPPPSAAQDGSQPPSRKESPMGGLFYWAHHGVGSGNSSNTSANTSPTSAGKKEADRAAALKVNVSPETTLTPQQLQPLQNQAQVMAQLQSSSSHPQHQQQHSAERMPRQLKVEMKENISPENTITNKLLLSSNAPAGVDVSTVLIAPSSPAPVAAAPIVNVAPATTAYAKVIFQLGGDYDDGQSATSDTVVVLSHLGQLARDSLSMFKNPSLTSQDSISIRSMDSLTEIGGDTKTAAGRKDASPVMAAAATAVVPPQPPTSTASSSSTPLASASAAAPLVADIQFETR
uniref:Uncharacterized protein n=1 Tax=Anopheles merus TaxID=30066 RepID=A0A182VLL5_ANOME